MANFRFRFGWNSTFLQNSVKLQYNLTFDGTHTRFSPNILKSSIVKKTLVNQSSWINKINQNSQRSNPKFNNRKRKSSNANLLLEKRRLEWFVPTAILWFGPDWNPNQVFGPGLLELPSLALDAYFVLAFHAVWSHFKKSHISAQIVTQILDLLSHNYKFQMLFL